MYDADGNLRLPPLVLIGAHSRAGRAIMRLWDGNFLVPIHRAAGDGIQVRDYTEVPKGIIPPGSFVVNCVGTPRGDERAMLRLNRDVAVQWARAAEEAEAAHFVQISSFAVYGRAERIGINTVESPQSIYGRSKLAADRTLSALSLPVTLLRIPMLFGDGPDKLKKLTSAVHRLNFVPCVQPQMQRSMLSYDALAAAVMQLCREPITGIVHAADPTPFTYELLSEVFFESTGRRLRKLMIPRWVAATARRLARPLHARLISSSLLDTNAALSFPIDEMASLKCELSKLARVRV